MPICFAVSTGETIPAVQALVESAIAQLRNQHGLDLPEQTTAVYLDGGPALLNVFPRYFPAATLVRCLEHVKKDATKARSKWKFRNHGAKTRVFMHKTAFWPKRRFSMFWIKYFHDLRADGEDDFVEYMLRNHMVEEKLFLTAPWQSYSGLVLAPFSSHSSNCIESFWEVVDQATKDKPRCADLLTEIRYIEEVCKLWLTPDVDGHCKFHNITSRITHVPTETSPISKASPTLVRGTNTLGDRPAPGDPNEKDNHQIRRLTTKGLRNLAARNRLCVDRPGEHGAHHYACVKYDGNLYDAQLQAALIDAVIPDVSDDARTAALHHWGHAVGRRHTTHAVSDASFHGGALSAYDRRGRGTM